MHPYLRRVHQTLVFAVAAAMAALLVASIQSRLPSQLTVRTDVVGYPIYNNFNVSRYFQTYYLILLLFPAATFAFCVALRALTTPSQWRLQSFAVSASGAAKPATLPCSRSKDKAVQVARTLFVGAVLGLEAGIVTGWTGWRLGTLVLLGAAVYLAVLGFAAHMTRGVLLPGMQLWERRSAINATVAPAVILMLTAVSASTQVVIGPSTSTTYPWLPVWLSLASSLGVGVAVGRALARSTTVKRAQIIERRVIVLVVGPVCLFLFIALLPGALGGMDVFHEGEWLVGAELFGRGWFPWRDFAVIHGAFYDILAPSVGMRLFENSRWGSTAGFLLLLVPVYWVVHYYFAAFVFRRNWMGIVGCALLVVIFVDVSMFPHLRFMFWPLILLALAAVLRDARPWRCVLFVGLVGVQVILTPEAVYAAVASGATVVLFELVEWRRRRSVVPVRFGRTLFGRTLWCAVAALGVAGAWLVLLAIHGAADDYLGQLLTFARDHRLVGGLPMAPVRGAYFPVAVVAPIVGVLVTVWCLGAKVRRREGLAIEDWLLVAAALMVVFYYPKFVARADVDHVAHVFATAMPMLLILVAKSLSWAEGLFARWRPVGAVRRLTGQPVTLVVVLALVPLAPVSLPERFSSVPRRFTATASPAQVFPNLGYAQSRWFDEKMMNELAAVMGSYLRPGEPVFDFTNQPGFIHYLLGYPPATRYYHVSMALRRDTQRELIAELARTRPRLVVFQNDQRGFPAPDGVPNIIRHYEVSQYLLDHYQPWVEVHRYVLFVPREADVASLPPLPTSLDSGFSGEDLLFRGYPCDWRYAPNFLTTPDAADAQALSLPVRRVGPNVTRIELPPGTDLSRFRWLDLEGAGRLRPDSFKLGMTGQPPDGPPAAVPVPRGGGVHASGGPHRTIRFRSLGGRSIRVRVGSCPAWHGYTTSSLHLTHGAEQEIAAVRLLP